MVDPDIICETRGAAGLVVLNRPAALNAINHDMVRELARALDTWEADPRVTRIVVMASGERAFSAGGDIRALYEQARAGRYDEALAFWAEEYRLNIRIKTYPKPYIALIDGMVMGGGVGLSLHGSHRVAGERYRFAMPEVGIGFFPDVGATYALPRLPNHVGMYLALTGQRIGPDDAATFGLATHLVASSDMPGLLDRLCAGEPVDAAIAIVVQSSRPGEVALQADLIESCFSAPSVPAILDRLDAAAAGGSDFAATAAATIRSKSPSSLAITFEQMRRGGDLTFEEAMAMEFRIVSRILRGHDFTEGVRATIIDKNGRPVWQPASLAEVDEADVMAHFADLGPAELALAR
jgi:enoyl-CoA hydratase